MPLRIAAKRHERMLASRTALLVLLLLGITGGVGCASPTASGDNSGAPPVPLPHFAHIVVVVEENHGYDQIIGSADAPYLNSLAREAALFTDAHAVTHPSQPNYLALFAGSTFGLASDACPQSFAAPNLGGALLAHGATFIGYSESLPRAGYTGCDDGSSFDPLYARKHNPWVNFADVPAASNQPFGHFPTDFDQLPTVAFVVPNQRSDMHSGSIHVGDSWLRQHLDAYVRWASSHESLLIVTWDEDDGSTANHIATLFIGAHVRAGQYAEAINHYAVLCTIEAIENLPFSKTYPFIPKAKRCLVPVSSGTVSPGLDDHGQRSPLHRRFDSPTNCRRVSPNSWPRSDRGPG
jgi:phosphatidylinositol-3-phosphatase